MTLLLRLLAYQIFLNFILITYHVSSWASPLAEELPPEIKHRVIIYLDVPEIVSMSKVSKEWLAATNDKEIWVEASKRMNVGLYSSKKLENLPFNELKELVKNHYLSVFVNTIDNCEQVYHLVHSYSLKGYHTEILSDFFNKLARPFYGLSSDEDRKELCAQKRDSVIASLTSPSKEDRKYLYPEEAKFARDINDWLVLQGDDEAINRQIEGAMYGFHGYESQGWDKTQELIEYFAANGSEAAIMHKIRGYTMGYTHYKQDYSKGRELIESLVEKGSDEGLVYKAHALVQGQYGYRKNVSAARSLYTLVAQKGGRLATHAALFAGIKLPEEKDYKVPDLNPLSTDEKNLIHTLVYNRESPSLITDILSLESKGNPLGYYLKSLGMKYGIFGFSKNRLQAIEYIKRNWIPF